MSPSEIFSRIGDQAHLLRLKLKHKSPPALLPSEPPGSERKPEFRVGAFTLNTSAIVADYPSILEGSLSYGGGDWQFDEGGDVWHVEHTTLRQWPQAFFNSINYRPGNPVGDARRTWEPARLQQLVALAVRTSDLELAQGDGNAALALDMIERQLQSWWIHNPVLHGIHYVSAMECGLRCVAVTHTASLLEARGRLSPNVRAVVLSLLQQHADFIRKRISTHSSSGNHTLAECAGLIYASLLLPDRDESSGDEGYAVNLFTREFDRQVLADGGGIEQATWYHRFNVELAECVSSTLNANGREVPAKLAKAIERGGRFLKAVLDSGQGFVKLGDADDGYALSKYYEGQWRRMPQAESIQHFKQTGLSCIRVQGVQVMVQYGSLGMAPAYGHGHADALNIVASVDGQRALCDSGTGAYGGESAAQRAHFRSCAAHNTVQVGSSDFAQVLSPFMWANPYSCELLHERTSLDEVELWLCLSVNAQKSFKVCRYVRVDCKGLQVADRISLEGSAQAVQRWHLPAISSTQDGNDHLVELGETTVKIDLGGSDVPSVLQKQMQRSERYGELESVTRFSSESSVTGTAWFYMRMVRASHDSDSLNQDELAQKAMEYFE